LPVSCPRYPKTPDCTHTDPRRPEIIEGAETATPPPESPPGAPCGGGYKNGCGVKTRPNRPRHQPDMTPAHGCQADQALLRHNRSTGPDGYRFSGRHPGFFIARHASWPCSSRQKETSTTACSCSSRQKGTSTAPCPCSSRQKGTSITPCPHRKAFLARCLHRRNASVTLHPCKFHGHTGFCQKVHAPGTRLPPAKLNRPSTPSAQTDAMKQRRC